MTEDAAEQPLVCAYSLDGAGGGVPLGWDDVSAPAPPGGFVWVHLRRTSPPAQEWLAQRSGLDPIVVDALLAEETRPRFADHEDGILINLRGVNLNPGAAPEDMVSIRMWVTRDRIVSARYLRIRAVEDLVQTIARGVGPRTPALFVAQLADRLSARVWPVISRLDDQLDDLEDTVIGGESFEMRGMLAGLRRQAVVMRRYIAPQRDALSALTQSTAPFIGQRERNRLREAYDGAARNVEALDELRDRAAVIHDELTSRLSDQMNRRLYVLSVAAAIFLPLNLLAGMLGMNVAGVPGGETPSAFAMVAGFLMVLGVLQYVLLRRLKWI